VLGLPALSLDLTVTSVTAAPGTRSSGATPMSLWRTWSGRMPGGRVGRCESSWAANAAVHVPVIARLTVGFIASTS
jgi:hypothetical protein